MPVLGWGSAVCEIYTYTYLNLFELGIVISFLYLQMYKYTNKITNS